MNYTKKLFNGKKLRAVYDKNKKVHLISVVDVISAITNKSYDTARNHWKQIKFRLKDRNHPLLKKINQMKFKAKDGLYRYTDVMDYKDIVKLIQALPYKVAEKIKNLIGGIACSGNKIANILARCIIKEIVPQEHHFIKQIVCTHFKM